MSIFSSCFSGSQLSKDLRLIENGEYRITDEEEVNEDDEDYEGLPSGHLYLWYPEILKIIAFKQILFYYSELAVKRLLLKYFSLCLRAIMRIVYNPNNFYSLLRIVLKTELN